VTSREQRRRAEDVAESVSGVTHVQNNLRVKNQEQSWSGNNTSANTNRNQGSSGGIGTLGSATGTSSAGGVGGTGTRT
jgi:hypothetical protein